MTSTAAPAPRASRLTRALTFTLAVAASATPARATWSILLIDTRTGEIAIGSATCLTGRDLRALTPVLVINRGAATAQASVSLTSITNRAIIWNGLQQGSSAAATKITATPFQRSGGSTSTLDLTIPTVAFDSYHLVAEVSDGVNIATGEWPCPLYVHPQEGRLPGAVWLSARQSTVMVEGVGIGRRSNGDSVVAGNWTGTVTTPLKVISGGLPSIYLSWLRRADGTIVAEHFAQPMLGGWTDVSGVAVLSDDTCIVVGSVRGSVDFGPDEQTAAPRIVDAARRQTFAVRYVFRDQGAVVRNVVTFSSAGNVTSGGIARVAGTDATIVVGTFEGAAQFGALNRTARGDSDGFVLRLEPDLSVFWVAQIGGGGADLCLAVSAALQTDASVRIAVGGAVQGDVQVGSADGITLQNLTTEGGSADAFVANYTGGGIVQWAARAGGPGSDVSGAMAISADNVVFLGGEFSGTANFTDRYGTRMERTSEGLAPAVNGFVAKYDGGGRLRDVSALRSPQWSRVRALALLTPVLEEVVVVGDFEGVLETGPWAGGAPNGALRSMGRADAFIAHLSTAPVDNLRLRRLRGFGDVAADSVRAVLVTGAQEYHAAATVSSLQGSLELTCDPLRGLRIDPSGRMGAAVIRFEVSNSP